MTLMPYNGNGKIVTVDLQVGGVGEDDEEKDGVFMGLNAPSATASNAGSDTDLVNATLSLTGQGESGKWSLSFPEGIKVWQQNGGAWQPIVSGTESAAVTLPASVALKVEGANTGTHEIAGNLKLTAPAASQAIQDKVKATVVSVTIAKAPAGFAPRGGDQDNTVELQATVLPNTIKGKFRFTLFETSNEPGYCMNAPLSPPTSGENSASWKDLQFPAQTGLTLTSSNSVAETTKSDLNQQKITVKAYDYGAYGKLGVRLILPDGTELVAKEAGGTRGYTNIPLDDNDNHIPDSMGQDSGPTPAPIVGSPAPVATFAATDDNDNTPVGAGVDGDGISRYEEYRGFVVQGAHKRLSTLKKDVFFRNVDVTDAGNYGFFTEANLTAPTHSIAGTEYIDATRVVNFNSDTAHIIDQQAIKITDGGVNGYSWGEANASALPRTPNVQLYCRIYVTTIPKLPPPKVKQYLFAKEGRKPKICLQMRKKISFLPPKSANLRLIRTMYCLTLGVATWVTIKNGTFINKVGGVNATDTTIPVASALVYRPSGTLLIEGEQITYTGISGNVFTGCVRGANGTVAASHANGTKVAFFTSESDFIRRTFAHEAGHLVALLHSTPSDQNVMSELTQAGTTLGDGYWSSFIGVNSSVQGHFQVRN